jgi:hypothetical protein
MFIIFIIIFETFNNGFGFAHTGCSGALVHGCLLFRKLTNTVGANDINMLATSSEIFFLLLLVHTYTSHKIGTPKESLLQFWPNDKALQLRHWLRRGEKQKKTRRGLVHPAYNSTILRQTHSTMDRRRRMGSHGKEWQAPRARPLLGL